jgi:hypothetical protein
MKMFRFATTLFASFLLAGLLSGCATAPKIDWVARVGNYSYDQAVIEFGPPDKESTLSDGTRVAEWLMRRGYRQVYPMGGYYYPQGPYGYGWYYPPTYIDTSSPDYFLRLTFNADGQLRTWKKFSR